MCFLLVDIITAAFNENIWLERAGNHPFVYLNISMFYLFLSPCVTTVPSFSWSASKDDFSSIWYMFLFPWLEGIEGGVNLTLPSENVSSREREREREWGPVFLWLLTNLTFKHQFHKIAKHTQTIRRQFADELFECVWPFCGIGIKELILS